MKLKNRIKVEVTAQDIRRGKRGTCQLCPVAKTVKRVLGRGYRVSICDDIYVTAVKGDIGEVSFNMPVEAQTFINNFDYGRPVKPFSFVAVRYR